MFDTCDNTSKLYAGIRIELVSFDMSNFLESMCSFDMSNFSEDACEFQLNSVVWREPGQVDPFIALPAMY